MNANRIVNSW